jgi:hypothetical protein
MPATQLVALNGSGGAFTAILATQADRRVDFREDESVTPQGLQYQRPDDSFVKVLTVGTPASPDQPQLTLGNPVSFGVGRGPLIGMAQQNSSGNFNFQAATTLVKMKSKTAQGTTVRVVETE